LVSGLGLQVNLLYPVLGLVIGLGQGIIAALITTVLIIEHHPLEHFHHRLTLVFSQVAGHLVFGMVVMLSQSLIFQFWNLPVS
ncbi:MAG: hypothetical protein KC422_17450, partial [Trueperaceae bacterium]|nr:hypothetical protein [Trueperaceae bacterium]